MDDLFADLIFKTSLSITLKSKLKNRSDPTYDYSGLLSIVDVGFND